MASNCNGARKLFAKMQEDDIVLADMRLPDGDGIALLEELRKQGRNNPYIVMTEHGEIPIAVRSLKLAVCRKGWNGKTHPFLNEQAERSKRYTTR